MADNIQAFAKSLSGSVDEVVESGGKLRDNTLPLDLSETGILNTKPKNSPAPQKMVG
ncbi:TPA: hypothetical protein ACGOVM_002197 [Streptococcus suis]